MVSNDKKRKEDGEVSAEEGEEVSAVPAVKEDLKKSRRSGGSRSHSEDRGGRKNEKESNNVNGTSNSLRTQ